MENTKKHIKLIQFIIIILFLNSCNAQLKIEKEETIIETEKKLSKIDSLNTKLEVENFIRNRNSNYNEFELKRIQDFDRDYKTDSLTKLIAKRLKITESYYKTDFDNNGYTDLLVIGDNKDCWSGKSCSFNSIVLMSFENDSIKFINLVKDRFTSIVPLIEKEKEKTHLVINYPNQINWKIEKYKDGSSYKLIYKNGNFIEFNSNPITHNIERIEFSTSACFGKCPIFQLNINNKREAIFIAEHYNLKKNHDNFNEKVEGTFNAIISNEKYKEIIKLINYLDFEKLKNDYSVGGTDNQECSLKIIYDGGKVKMINDYGLTGTFGLKKLYQLLFEIRFNQEWR